MLISSILQYTLVLKYHALHDKCIQFLSIRKLVYCI